MIFPAIVRNMLMAFRCLRPRSIIGLKKNAPDDSEAFFLQRGLWISCG
jgi:hypothetical protein